VRASGHRNESEVGYAPDGTTLSDCRRNDAARNTRHRAQTPLFSINALPDRVTPRWPPSLLLSLGSDIKASPLRRWSVGLPAATQ